MTQNLFFVESIYKPLSDNSSTVTLLSAENDGPIDNGKHAIIRQFRPEELKMHNHWGNISEGWYVFYDEGNQIPFGYGNLSPFARARFREYYKLREDLVKRTITQTSEAATIPPHFQDSNSTNIVSFHLNVGHGNCSIVLIESNNTHQIWMIDCSTKDLTDHWKSYQENLELALRHISKRIGRPEGAMPHIDRFFLTHAHYDHYSGIEYLTNKHIIDNNTICYLNLYYQMASPAYINALSALKNANVAFIEPVTANSTNAIQFLHPKCRIFRSKATIKKARGLGYDVVGNANDSSVVVMLNLGGKSMVFTGDLQQNGFKRMSNSGTCCSYLIQSDYYIVSHHGSLNGHPTITCGNNGHPQPSPLVCATNNLRKAILMGRNGAYRGIYDLTVTSYWNGVPNRLVCSETSPHFIELNWRSGQVDIH